MKYIDADKLIKAIEEKGLECSFAMKMERLNTLALIDELQQEQPEVDLEKFSEKIKTFPCRICVARLMKSLGKANGEIFVKRQSKIC